jgi:hypothetical protein
MAGITARQFICGFCGDKVASKEGYVAVAPSGSGIVATLCICPGCSKPTFFDPGGSQTPGVTPGNEVEHLPPGIKSLYNEARKSAGAGALRSFTKRSTSTIRATCSRTTCWPAC